MSNTANVLSIGDVIIAKFPTQNPQGREQEGIRPALVVGIPDKLGIPRFSLIFVAPMTSDRSQSWAIASPQLYPKLPAGLAGLPRDSLILLDQMRTIDLNRVLRYLGTLSPIQYSPILQNLQQLITP